MALAASPSAALTRGLGSWGSIGLTLTLGLGLDPGNMAEGLEYTLPKNRLHFNVRGRPLDYTIPKGRGHFTGRGEDR